MSKNLTNSKNNVDTRYRNFEYVVYDGDSNMSFASIEMIEKIANGDFYATIMHHSDNGKNHWHCFFSFENNKTLSAFCKVLRKLGFGDEHLPHDNFPGNVRVKDDMVSAVQYLAHLSPNAIKEHKTSYSIDEIKTNDDERMRKCFLNTYTRSMINSSKNLMIAQTYSAIDDMEYISRSEWFKQCNEWGIDSNIAKANDVLKYIDDHNKKYEKTFLYDLELQANVYKDIRGKVVSVFNKAIDIMIEENKEIDLKMALDMRNKTTALIYDQLTGIIADIELNELGGVQ